MQGISMKDSDEEDEEDDQSPYTTPTLTPIPIHTFDFSLVTDACTNSDSHSRTSLSARNAYEGTINYKNSTYTEENQNKNDKKIIGSLAVS